MCSKRGSKVGFHPVSVVYLWITYDLFFLLVSSGCCKTNDFYNGGSGCCPRPLHAPPTWLQPGCLQCTQGKKIRVNSKEIVIFDSQLVEWTFHSLCTDTDFWFESCHHVRMMAHTEIVVLCLLTLCSSTI